MFHLDECFKWEIDKETGFRKLIFTYETNFIKEIDKFKIWDGEYKTCSKCGNKLPANTYFFMSRGNNKLHTYCKICEGSKLYGWGRKEWKRLNELGYKYCATCDRILPLNIFYFNSTIGRFNKNGYSSNCKKCLGNSFSIYSINDYRGLFSVKEGYKICTKCNLELPDDDYYFFKKNDRENGMCICKKCNKHQYGIYKLNVTLKDIIPNGYKYCNSCKLLVPINELDSEGHICKKCAKEKRKIYHNKPETKLRLRKFRHNRIAKIKQLKNDLTIEQWEDTLEYFNNNCAYCGMNEKEHYILYNQSLHHDHIIPICQNGEYTKNNIIPACSHCNLSKNKKSLEEYFSYADNFTKENYIKILEFIKLNS